MSPQKRIEVTATTTAVGEIVLVRFHDRKIMDQLAIQELADELFALVENDQQKNILLNFTGVEFLASAALNKLMLLDKKVKAAGGQLQLFNVKPEIFEILAVTRLTQLFTIKRTEQEALAAFAIRRF